MADIRSYEFSIRMNPLSNHTVNWVSRDQNNFESYSVFEGNIVDGWNAGPPKLPRLKRHSEIFLLKVLTDNREGSLAILVGGFKPALSICHAYENGRHSKPRIV